MPSQEGESVEDAGDQEQRVQDWTEFFRIFQEDERLEPHHNVEIKELFSLPEVRERGEIIFYYGDYGSFWMQYSPELYQDGFMVQGDLEVNPTLLNLRIEASGMEPDFILEDVKIFHGKYPAINYLYPLDELDREIGAVQELKVLRDYESHRVVKTIEEGISVLDSYRHFLSEFDE
jgi:hypothetical protein